MKCQRIINILLMLFFVGSISAQEPRQLTAEAEALLQCFKIGRKPTQPGVYIHHGKKVLIKLKK